MPIHKNLKKVLELHTSLLGFDYTDPGLGQKQKIGFEDFRDALVDANKRAYKKGKIDTFQGTGGLHRNLLDIIYTLEIMIDDILPPTPTKGHDEYPVTYSSTDILIKTIIEFYYEFRMGKIFTPTSSVFGLKKLVQEGIGSKKNPGPLFLFIQDVCDIVRAPISYDNFECLRKKIREVMKKIDLLYGLQAAQNN